MHIVQKENNMTQMTNVSDLKRLLKNKEITSDTEVLINVDSYIYDIKQFSLSKCDCCDKQVLLIQCEEREYV